MDHIASGIHLLGQPLDRSALSSCIPSFKSKDYRDPVPVQFSVEFLQFILKLFQLLLIFFFGTGKR